MLNRKLPGVRSLVLCLTMALVASAPAWAAKGGACHPSLPAPTGLGVTFDSGAFTATWNDVPGALKYAVEMTAHYDGYPDETFSFTVPDANPAVLATTSITVPLSALQTVVCNDPPTCSSLTTYDATSVDVWVKALNPPTTKGKVQAQCNPFAGPAHANAVVIKIVISNPPADETFSGTLCFSVIATNPIGTPTITVNNGTPHGPSDPKSATCPTDDYSTDFEVGFGLESIQIDVTDNASNHASKTVTWLNGS
jgi:hypothetical protein